LNKSRDSLLRLLGPSVRLIQRQQASKRTVLLVCEDGQWGQAQVEFEAGQIESHETNRTVSDCMSNMSVYVCVFEVSYISCICAAASLRCASSTSLSDNDPTPAAVAASAAAAATFSSSSSAAPSSSPAAAAAIVVDKSSIRTALTVAKTHLPQHFPTRLLLKQLNTFFLSEISEPRWQEEEAQE
jgi:hypothetical protein